MEWIKSQEFEDTFTCEKYFGKYKYVVEIWAEWKPKSIRFWVSASSGKKRKEIRIFEDKDDKSLGGIRALLWVKEAMLSFPKFYTDIYKTENYKVYLCVRWADNRRRKIYERLIKDGFYYRYMDSEKTLVKEILWE